MNTQADKQDRRILKGGMLECAAGGAMLGALIGLLQLIWAGMLIGAVIGAAGCAAASRTTRPGVYGALVGAGLGAFFGGWWEGPLGGGHVMQIILAVVGAVSFSAICKHFSVTPDKLDDSSAGKSDSAPVVEDDSEWFDD